jgi:hypothetical protein
MAGAQTPRLSSKSPWTNTARECTLRLPFRDSLLIKSILYKNGRGSNPKTIVEKSVDKHGQGMYPETTLSDSLQFKSILYKNGRGLNPK